MGLFRTYFLVGLVLMLGFSALMLDLEMRLPLAPAVQSRLESLLATAQR